ncbi:scavenger receptor class B member 1 [Musca domestica]|uniref:CD36 family protein n=1 Tax=Musca domestica TaxID=7370 RepID=T1PIR5_MUSDO|nr:scavenger receptor class B member 1 [Musca domestica]
MKLFTTSRKTANILKFAALGMTLSILAVVILVSDPVELVVDSQLTLRTGSLLFNLWKKPPLEVFMKVYMFNVTNLDEYVRGIDAKLRVTEVGPYVYQEILTNHNVTFNDNDTITFMPRREVKFIREKSIGDPKDDHIIAPNIPYMGASSAATSLSTFAALGVSALTRQMKSKPMLRMSVYEYLWGYEDNLVELASRFVPNFINFRRFGILERIFDEGENTVTMKLPSKSKKTKSPGELRDYALDTWNGGVDIKYWSKNRGNITNCNSIHGTYDGTLFPRQITKGETFRIYRKAFCRALPIVYSHPGKIDGIEAYHFKLHENAFDSDFTDPDTSCYCSYKKCLKKGLGNVTPCYYNIPLAISFPHFFNADPSLLNGVDGLSPNESKHGSEVAIQPQLGIPMRVYSRFQVNLMVDDVKFNREMYKFRNTVFPLLWLEFGVEELTPELKVLLQILFKVCPYLQNGIIIALFIAGLALLGTSLFKCFRIPTSTITSTAAIVATSIIPAGTNNSSCNKMLALAEETKKKARRLSKAHVAFAPLVPLVPQVAGEMPDAEEQEQLLEMELELGEQQELLDMEMELELEKQQKQSSTFVLPEYRKQ